MNGRSMKDRLIHIFRDSDYPEGQLERLAKLINLFALLPPPPDPVGLFPDYERFKQQLLLQIDKGHAEQIEEALLELYCHLHGHEAPYTEQERCRIDRTGGYWCHAGGLSPILRAGDWIKGETVSADYGAGNGLQTLLMMKLYPHAKTIQVEISSKMVRAGMALQEWLGIEKAKVEWRTSDIFDVPAVGMDFIYMYRPVKPEGEGRRFYRKFADEISASKKEVVIFSIADCLRDFLPSDFEVFYTDGHLTCFRFPGAK